VGSGRLMVKYLGSNVVTWTVTTKIIPPEISANTKPHTARQSRKHSTSQLVWMEFIISAVWYTVPAGCSFWGYQKKPRTYFILWNGCQWPLL